MTKKGIGIAGTYELNGWKVFCNGDAWYIKNPEGYVYAKSFKRSAFAKKFAEEKMKG